MCHAVSYRSQKYAVVDSSIEHDILKLNPEFKQQNFTHFSGSCTMILSGQIQGWGHFFSPYKAEKLLCAYKVET